MWLKDEREEIIWHLWVSQHPWEKLELEKDTGWNINCNESASAFVRVLRQVRDCCSAERPELPSGFARKPLPMDGASPVDSGPLRSSRMMALTERPVTVDLGHIYNIPSQQHLDSYLMKNLGAVAWPRWPVNLTISGQILKLEKKRQREINSGVPYRPFTGVLIFLHFTFCELKNNVSNNLRHETLVIRFTEVPLGLSHEMGLCL